ncbi:MAG: hydrogenase maturation protease [Planctomycetota bacterium]|jgi:hydrogenase maturation protease
MRVLLIGYGNPGRLDDGLGPALAEAVAGLAIEGVTVESDFQLQVEDAARVAEHDVVVFADADIECPEPFEFRRVVSGPYPTFSHSVTPGTVLSLAREHFGAETAGFVLAIRGHEFDDYGERLSERATRNLALALEFIEPVLRSREFPGR